MAEWLRSDWSDPSDLSIPVEGDLRVWLVRLDRPTAVVARLARCLTADEEERAARFRFPHGALRFRVGRAALRMILGDILGVAPDLIRFGYGVHGKPELAPDFAGSGLRFNVSHSGGLALCAVTAHRPVGVDLEHLRVLPDLEAIAARVFSRREREELSRTPPTERHAAFFSGWTRKEAYLKARGEGFSRPTARFTVSLAPGVPARLEDVDDAPAEAGRWALQALTPAPTCVAALAVEGAINRLVRSTWPEPA